MNTPKQQKPFFLYIIISILAVAVIGLGGLALYSLNGLASLQSKVTELQDTGNGRNIRKPRCSVR